MKVSLLVPVYGVERYIARCAESLFGQTYEDIEYIFVDDCTPDASISVLEEVLERYPGRRAQVRIIRHDHNRGLGAARATALAASTGEAIMHVDSDDYMSTDAVEVLCRRMEDTGAEVVDGGYGVVYGDEVTETHMPHHGRTDLYVCLLLVQNIYSNRIWGRMYRRRLYDNKDIKHLEGVDYGEDYSVAIPLLFRSRRRFVDKIVYYYRKDNMSSYTHGMSRKDCISYIRANFQVYYYIYENAFFRSRSITAVQYGVLAAMRQARKNNISMKTFYDITDYDPTALMPRFCAFLFRSRCPYWIADRFYRLARFMYVCFLKAVYREKPNTHQAYWS